MTGRGVGVVLPRHAARTDKLARRPTTGIPHELAYAPGVGATGTRTTKEMAMELFAGMPEWWAWVAAGAVGAIALAALANILAAAFDLDAG